MVDDGPRLYVPDARRHQASDEPLPHLLAQHLVGLQSRSWPEVNDPEAKGRGSAQVRG